MFLETKNMPVDFKKDLGYRCPICKHLILPTNDKGYLLDPDEDENEGKNCDVNPCPHLIWCKQIGTADYYGYGDLAFMFVRSDVAKKIVRIIVDNKRVKQALKNHGIEISDSEILLFLIGNYDMEDEILYLSANLPIEYNQLLPPNTTIYRYTYSRYSTIEFAIDNIFFN
jgi:hypothetical protein